MKMKNINKKSVCVDMSHVMLREKNQFENVYKRLI